jgi:iron complex outermembrane receptor protein
MFLPLRKNLYRSPKVIQNALKLLLSASLFFSACLPIQAKETIDKTTLSTLEDEIKWIHEEQFVSTATKTHEKVSKSGASVSIITKQDLKRMGARNLMDALKRLPGFSVQETYIGIPAIEVRGTLTPDSEKVLFMIDGHSVNNNLVNGGATWTYNDFSIDDIRQIEVVRGPGSALYGANAFVAVINIITETADDISGLEVTLGSETDSTRKLNLQYGQELSDSKIAANLNILESNGAYQYIENDSVGNSGYTYDWQDRYDFSFNIQSKGFKLYGKYIDHRRGPFIGIGNALNDETIQDYTEYFLDLSYQNQLSSQISLSGNIYIDQFETKNYWEITPEGLRGSPTVKNQKTGAEVQLDYQLTDNNKLLTGFHFEHQTQFDVQHALNFNPNDNPLTFFEYGNRSDTLNWNSSQNRDVSAFYLQDIWDITKQLRLIAGYRYDKYSDFGKSVNPRTSITWEFMDDFNISAAYGKAFRAPNFAELYNINNPSIIGNPDLTPERIETYEISLNGQINKRNQFKITSFRNHINHLIEIDATNTYQNTGKLSINGVELELSSRLIGGSSFDANYTYQFAENEKTNEIQHHIPMHKANLGFNYRHSQLINAYIGILYTGKLSTKGPDPYDADSLKEKISVDTSISFSNKTDTLELSASIYNIFNAKNSIPSGDIYTGATTPPRHFAIPEQDRHIALKLRYKL